jgi:hypothetical protein
VLRIWDVYPGSRVQKIPDLGLSILSPKKKLFLSSQKYDPGCSSGVKKAPDPDLSSKLKKTASFLTRVVKNFFKIGRKGYQKKRNFALISKMCRTLASRSSQRFFLRKTIF